MARFIFRLEAVLRHRRHIEQQRQRELALVRRQMTELQQELKDLNDSVRLATEDMRQSHLTGQLDLNFLAAHRRYTFAVQRKSMMLAQKMALVQKQIDDAQKLLAEAARDRKAMEKLKERGMERWKAETDRKELLQQDEVSMQLAYQNDSQTLARDL